MEKTAAQLVTKGAYLPPLIVSQSRRYPPSSSKGILGSPSWPLTEVEIVVEDPPPPPPNDKGGTQGDTSLSGIERLIERFDRLEARLDNHDLRFDNFEQQNWTRAYHGVDALAFPPPDFNYDRGREDFTHGRDVEERWHRGVFYVHPRSPRGRDHRPPRHPHPQERPVRVRHVYGISGCWSRVGLGPSTTQTTTTNVFMGSHSSSQHHRCRANLSRSILLPTSPQAANFYASSQPMCVSRSGSRRR